MMGSAESISTCFLLMALLSIGLVFVGRRFRANRNAVGNVINGEGGNEHLTPLRLRILRSRACQQRTSKATSKATMSLSLGIGLVTVGSWYPPLNLGVESVIIGEGGSEKRGGR
mmetsp:Transcript_27213/g.44644  ORF Transcript_27213/g.44644 Transcript_27213/m.44644 type:complete len:114 (+) Transcript_27213:737-1078(+)